MQIKELTYTHLEELIKKEKENRTGFLEATIQNMVVAWLENNNYEFHPSFSGLRTKSWGQRQFMRNQGMRKGYPDIALYEKRGDYGGLFIELKTVRGEVSIEQKSRMQKLLDRGYACSVGKGYYDSIYKILKYLGGEPILWQEKNK